MKILFANQKKQSGAVLIIVLWTVLLLSLLLAGYSRNIRVETGIVRGVIDDIHLRAMVEGVASYLAQLNRADSELLAQLEGSFQEIEIGKKVASFRFIPEESYVSLNAAPHDLLQALIEAVAGDEVDAISVATAIIDWRDPDDLAQEDGAENNEYEMAGLKQRPANANFRAVDELAMVLGMTPSLTNRLKPYLSVYSNSTSVNYNYASGDLLSLLGQASDVENLESAGIELGDTLLENSFFSLVSSGTYRLRLTMPAQGVERQVAAEVVLSIGGGAITFEEKGSGSLYHIKHWDRYTAHFEDNEESTGKAGAG